MCFPLGPASWRCSSLWQGWESLTLHFALAFAILTRTLGGSLLFRQYLSWQIRWNTPVSISSLYSDPLNVYNPQSESNSCTFFQYDQHLPIFSAPIHFTSKELLITMGLQVCLTFLTIWVVLPAPSALHFACSVVPCAMSSVQGHWVKWLKHWAAGKEDSKEVTVQLQRHKQWLKYRLQWSK